MKTIHEQVKLIAHRGLSREYHENTLPAFVHACKSNFYGIETDIQFTKDNKIICFHDKTIKRLMGERLKISELKYKDLLLKDFKQKKTLTERTNVCPFRKYLRICKRYKKHCVIEIKCKASHKQIDALIKKIKFRRYLKNCIIISFNRSTLLYLRSKYPTLRLQLLINNPIKRYFSFCKANNIDISIYERLLTKDNVERLKAQGIKVAVWTVNNKSSAQKFINMGVDYITSDYLI